MTPSRRAAATPVAARHHDRTAAEALAHYADAYAADESILVRPVESYDGIELAARAVAALAGGSLLVTDLAGEHSHAAAGNDDHLAERTTGPADPLLAFHTSGSTGSPSCVIYRKETARAHARAIAASLGLTPEITYVALPPPRFAYGLSIVNSHLEADVPVTFVDPEWTLPGLTEVADSTDGDIALYALPQHTPLLLSGAVDPARVSRLFIAGGRISQASVRRLAEHFPRLRLTNMYGQAEMGPRLSMWDGDPAEFVEGNIGTPLPGVRLRVMPDETAVVADDAATPDATPAHAQAPAHAQSPGRIAASSEFAMWKLLKAPYTELLDGPGEGEIVTNDLAAEGRDGTLRHAGRADHVLNVAGTKVDLRRLQEIVTEAADPLIVRIGSKPSKVAGDDVPVIEIVPGPRTPARTGPIRRALHTEFGRLAGLFDIVFVQQLSLKESGK